MSGWAREVGEPWHQPLLRNRLDRDDPDAFRLSAVALGYAVHVREDALYLLQVRLASGVESYAALAAVEQLDIEMLLQRPDTVGDGACRDPELGRGAGEALAACRSLEETQAIERRRQHGRGTCGWAVLTCRPHVIAHLRLSRKPSTGSASRRADAIVPLLHCHIWFMYKELLTRDRSPSYNPDLNTPFPIMAVGRGRLGRNSMSMTDPHGQLRGRP